MKKNFLKFILAFSAGFFSHNLSAQKIEHIDTLPIKNIDASNKKTSNIMWYANLKQLANTIVIIDSKIYSLSSREFIDLKEEEILNMEIIKDESSEASIKNVIIIKKRIDRN